MDISDLGVVDAAEKAGKMPLLHPATGEDTGAVWHVLGYDAESVVRSVREADRALQAKGKDIDLADAMEARRLARVRAAVVGWGPFEWKGEEPSFSQILLDEITGDPNFVWIVDQVEAYGKDRANFMHASPKG